MDILNKVLTVILFLDCLFLVLLVLVQLPKKEAGLGTAFGGGTTDALFGAGAGNVLTTLTKWCAILFLVLCLLLSMDFMKPHEASEADMAGAADKNTTAPATPPGPKVLPPPPAPAPKADGNATGTPDNNASMQPDNNTTKPDNNKSAPAPKKN
jgi:protein translocase SecG subunit